MKYHFDSAKQRIDFIRGKFTEIKPKEAAPQNEKRVGSGEVMRYRLISIETNPVTFRMFPETINGRVVFDHKHYQRLEPGKTYETDDPAQMEYLRGHKEKVRYRPELENALKASGADYEVVLCKSCGGRVKKIEYRNVEVLDDE